MSQITIKDIAKIAGVSVTTVSRVLNGYRDVGLDTKEKVLRVIEECNYVPNANAKNLKLISSNTISIIVKGKDNLFLASLVAPIENAIPKNVFDVIVHYISESDNEYLVAKRLCREKKPEAIVFLGGTITNHMNIDKYIDIPCIFVTVDASALPYENVSSVTVNNKEAAKAAINLLLDLGHRKIAVIGGKEASLSAIGRRYLGVIEAFEEAGINDYDNMIIKSNFTIKNGYRAMCSFIERGNKFTAIFAMSDILAMGAAKACVGNNLNVPGDVSIIGFDGMEVAKYYNPSIATIRQSNKELVDKTVSILISAINKIGKSEHIILPYKVEKGGSIKMVQTVEK